MSSLPSVHPSAQSTPINRLIALGLLKPPAGRSVRIVHGLRGADTGCIAITANGRTSLYDVARLDVEGDRQGWELRKHDDTAPSGRAAPYNVLLDGIRSDCDCPAGCWRPDAPCRHVLALLTLAVAGLLR